jgi:hypothetical protein
MSPIPSSCSHCRRPFSADSDGARLAHLERDQAFCDQCVWLVEHPESSTRLGRESHRAAA